MVSPVNVPSGDVGGVLLLNENEVRQVLTMDMALEAVEEGLRKMALDEAQLIPRARVQTDHAMLHSMAAAVKGLGVMGAKVYATSRRNGAHFHFVLFDGKTGAVLCLMQADYLGQMRTGAASGVATQYMARADATEVGLFGSGKQARTQLQAICKVRRVRQVHVYSPHEQRRTQFAREMSELCQTEVVPASHPEMAAEKKDIIITATTSREPVLNGNWLAQGAHINAIGSNFLGKAELDVTAIRRSAAVVIDSKDQARLEAGDFQQALEDGSLHWSNVRELGQVVIGRYTARKHPQDITLFKSLGIAVEDVAVGARVFANARAQGVGKVLADW
jgi:ornithine cyclodeaminase/alanine dehydrogenase-like protein (mu-crystallin family)